MNRRQQSAQARRQMDRKLHGVNVSAIRARPQGGWIRSVRTALGMSGEALAVRLGVTRSAVTKLELGEARGGITIGKLDEIAAALDCTLVYALIPNTTFEDAVMRQARRVAERQLGYVATSMALEDQGVDDQHRADFLDSHARDLVGSTDIWREDRPRSSNLAP